MPKQDSTPKESSGGGYLFENEVDAYVLAHLLSRSSPFDPPGGVVERIDTQRPPSEWHLDDLLVTVRIRSRHSRLAFSIKSNRHITGAGFPHDFIREAWEQLLHDSSEAFEESSDYLGLVTAPLDRNLTHNLFELLRRARDQEPADLAFQVELPGRANDAMRRLHESARCPGDLAAKHGVDAETSSGRLLRRLLWVPLDFEHDGSDSRSRALWLCRDLLRSGSTDEASALWEKLKGIAHRLRRSAGGIDLPRLLDELREPFALRGFPDYADDWSRLDEDTRSALRRVRVTIGGAVTLPRAAEHQRISEAFEVRRTVVLLGVSGSGKSTIAKKEAEAAMSRGNALWLDAGRINASATARWGQERRLAQVARLFEPAENRLAALQLTKGRSPRRGRRGGRGLSVRRYRSMNGARTMNLSSNSRNSRPATALSSRKAPQKKPSRQNKRAPWCSR